MDDTWSVIVSGWPIAFGFVTLVIVLAKMHGEIDTLKETVEKFSTLQKVNAGQIRLFKGSSDGANISKSLFQFV